MAEETRLAGKVAVVTGGAGGIGEAVSRLLARHGALVCVVDVDAERANAVVRDIESAGGAGRAHVADVREPAAVEALAAEVLGEHGRVDVLVNNVGHYLRSRPLLDSDPAHWDALYRVNLHHVFLVTKAFLPAMVERRSGSIINVSSVEGLRGYPPDPVYGAFKAAVVHFTTCLAVDVGRHGVRVNGIAPDVTQTIQVDYGRSVPKEQEHMWEIWAPLGRVGMPKDQAEVVLFLASDESRFVTGHTIPTDAGTRAAGGWFWSRERKRWVNRPKEP